MRVRKIGLGALAWRGGSLAGGEVGDVPLPVVERYAHKLEILDPMPSPEPAAYVPPKRPPKDPGEMMYKSDPPAKPRARKRKSR